MILTKGNGSNVWEYKPYVYWLPKIVMHYSFCLGDCYVLLCDIWTRLLWLLYSLGPWDPLFRTTSEHSRTTIKRRIDCDRLIKIRKSFLASNKYRAGILLISDLCDNITISLFRFGWRISHWEENILPL